VDRQADAPPRSERLLTGTGRFNDDVTLPASCTPRCALALRACSHRLDRCVRGAIGAGCRGGLHGADVVADGLGAMPFAQLHKRPDGTPITAPPRYPITPDVARFVGDAVAMVVAETRNQAKDAARW